MKELKLFYLEDCPYCHYARRAVRELAAEKLQYAVEIRWIEESKNPEIADRYQYYYVPTIFCGEEKLYEAHPGESYAEVKEHIRGALDRALQK